MNVLVKHDVCSLRVNHGGLWQTSNGFMGGRICLDTVGDVSTTRGQVQGPAYAQWDLVFVDCVVYASSESVRQWIDVNVDANNLLAVSPATHARTSMNSEHGSGQRGHMSVTHGTLCMNCNGKAKSRGDLPCHLQQ